MEEGVATLAVVAEEAVEVAVVEEVVVAPQSQEVDLQSSMEV